MGYEQLRVYQAACELRNEVEKLRPFVDPRFASHFEHLVDAADSVENNIAEGSQSIYVGKRIMYFDIAMGSAAEARSALNRIDAKGGFSGKKIYRPAVLALAVKKMLLAAIKSLRQKEY